MRARQKLTGRYQLLMGPWYHVTAGDGIDMDRAAPAVVRPVAQGHRHRHRPDARRRCTFTSWAAAGTSRRALPVRRGHADAVLPRRRQHAHRAGRRTRRAPTRSCSPARRARATASPTSGAPAAPRSRPAARTRAPTTTARCRRGRARSTYTTRAVQRADRVLAGPIAATLYATSTRPDTFFEVDARGRRSERHVDPADRGRAARLVPGARRAGRPGARPAATRSCPTTRTRGRRSTPVADRQGHALRRRGLPDLREDREGPQPAADAHDLGHAAPRLHARPAAEPGGRRLRAAAKCGRGSFVEIPTAPADAFTRSARSA